jgi:hypothetical protein
MKLTFDTTKSVLLIGAVILTYFTYKKVKKEGAAVVDAVREVIKKDLNPLNPNNVVYKNTKELPVVKQLNNVLGSIYANVVDQSLMSKNRQLEVDKIEEADKKDAEERAAAGQSFYSITGLSQAKYDIMGNRIY